MGDAIVNSTNRFFGAGIWYYVITILSVGLLACVPFLHAASTLKRPQLWKLGAAYALASLVTGVMFYSAPVDATGTPTGWMGNLGGFLLLAIIVAACVQQTPLRRQVYKDRPRPLPAAPMSLSSSHAVAAIEQARAKRRAARDLAQRDPLMARDLRIGRPDLPRQYDDGGLVDLNSAPVQVIAQACELPLDVAQTIAEVRTGFGRFSSVDEAVVYAKLNEDAADIMKDRAIVIPIGGGRG